MTRSILVATDGKPGATGALRMAQLLSARSGASVRVAAVYEPIDLYEVGSPEEVAHLPEHYVPAAIEAVHARVRDQLVEIGGGAPDWPISVHTGRVAATIGRSAVQHDADLILLGLRQSGGVEEWLARETLLRLIHVAHIPVLAVPADVTRLPQNAAVAVDFTDFSLRAARAAREIVAPGGRLHLVHVTSTPKWGEIGIEAAEWERTYGAGIKRRLNEIAAELLESSGDAAIHVHIRTGDARKELLRIAEELGADLIAAGSHGSGFIGRIVLGSVSSKLVHGAACSLLIVPPERVPEELAEDPGEP